MSCSRQAWPLGSDGFWPAARTPGPLGLNDQADPNVCALLGDTPGLLGFGDGADPSLPLFTEATGAGGLFTRLADGTALSMPAGATEPEVQRAPWMKIAEDQARTHKGAKEGAIQKSTNFHKELGTGRAGMEGSDNAWCAAFVNWCLKEAGYDVDNDGFADRKAAMGRAHAFFEVTKDKVKKGEKAAPKVRNPLYTKLDAPVYGAIGVVTKKGGHGHHVGFVYSQPEGNTVVLLGGNQSDTIRFSEYNIAAVAATTIMVKGHKKTIPAKPDHLMFFVPASYEATARADTTPLGTDSAEALNIAFGIARGKPGAPETTR